MKIHGYLGNGIFYTPCLDKISCIVHQEYWVICHKVSVETLRLSNTILWWASYISLSTGIILFILPIFCETFIFLNVLKPSVKCFYVFHFMLNWIPTCLQISLGIFYNIYDIEMSVKCPWITISFHYYDIIWCKQQ